MRNGEINGETGARCFRIIENRAAFHLESSGKALSHTWGGLAAFLQRDKQGVVFLQVGPDQAHQFASCWKTAHLGWLSRESHKGLVIEV